MSGRLWHELRDELRDLALLAGDPRGRAVVAAGANAMAATGVGAALAGAAGDGEPQLLAAWVALPWFALGLAAAGIAWFLLPDTSGPAAAERMSLPVRVLWWSLLLLSGSSLLVGVTLAVARTYGELFG